MTGERKSIAHRIVLAFITGVILLLAGKPASADVKIPAIKPGETIQEVKTLAWNAKLTINVKTKYGSFKRGTKVKVLKSGRKSIILLKGHKFEISRRYLNFLNDLSTIQKDGDYNTSTKIHYANKTVRKSRTKYFIWVSLDKQRVNVYKGSSKNWKLIRVMKCTTGMSATTPLGYYTIGWRKPEYMYCSYYMEFAGSGFHKWPGSGVAKIGTHVKSHGCIRLTKRDAQWMYRMIPNNTRVYIY